MYVKIIFRSVLLLQIYLLTYSTHLFTYRILFKYFDMCDCAFFSFLLQLPEVLELGIWWRPWKHPRSHWSIDLQLLMWRQYSRCRVSLWFIFISSPLLLCSRKPRLCIIGSFYHSSLIDFDYCFAWSIDLCKWHTLRFWSHDLAMLFMSRSMSSFSTKCDILLSTFGTIVVKYCNHLPHTFMFSLLLKHVLNWEGVFFTVLICARCNKSMYMYFDKTVFCFIHMQCNVLVSMWEKVKTRFRK